jgi:ABC-type lipoprotein release transport system permease subunit
MLESISWNTAPRDPLTYGVGAVLLMAIVMLASYVWARRAVRVDAVEALRAE